MRRPLTGIVAAVVSLAATTCAATATSASGQMGIIPKATCWGTCGGDFGPQPVAFFIDPEHRLSSFEIVEPCLGTRLVQGPTGKVRVSNGVSWGTLGEVGKKTLAIKNGKVTFAGKAIYRTSDTGTSHRQLSINVSIVFTSATRSHGTLNVSYAHCTEPFHFAARAG